MTENFATLADNTHFDVVIVGAGMVGASAALGFSLANKKVLLIDAFELGTTCEVYSPSYDARSTALSWGSREIFEQLGIWNTLAEHVTAIETVHVSQKGRFGTTRMHAAEMAQAALGYVIPNQWLGQCLLAAIDRPNITLCTPAKVTRIINQADHRLIELRQASQSKQVQAELLIVADGNNSETSKLLGIEHSVEHYHQYALIANVTTGLPNQGVAYERFTPDGPLALLPLSEYDSALVWTHENTALDNALALSDEAFCQRLQAQFGDRLGTIIKAGKREAYPLKLVRAKEQFRPGVVLLGNAAHSLHPVAGQGFNLALRGVAALIDQLQSHAQQADALQAFYQQQKADQDRTIHMSDQLVKLFGHDSSLLAIARDFGLIGLNNITALKSMFAKAAMGMAGKRSAIQANQGKINHG